MKEFNVKDSNYFTLLGSNALDEPGFSRINKKDLEVYKPINPDASYHALSSAGIQIRFSSDTKKIVIKVKLGVVSNMNNMSSLGQSGVDIYVYNSELKKYVFQKSTPFNRLASDYEYELVNNKEKELNHYIINLPLYNSVESLSLLLDKDALVTPYNKTETDNIVFYGTSIVQGGTVTRAGLLYSNVISRRLNNEIFNFGFSGSAFLEKEIAAIISKVNNPKVLIVDAEPNAGSNGKLKSNLLDFIKEYRKNHPKTSILVCSRIDYASDYKDKDLINMKNDLKAFAKNLVEELSKTDKNIHFVDGSDVFGPDFYEYTVDGVHPNDLGAMKLADFYYDEIKKYL